MRRRSLPVVKKKKSPKERFFQGRIWVDDQDLQIVKARGKGVPEGRERFPTFETYREQIDGRFWFPTYTFADDNWSSTTGKSFVSGCASAIPISSDSKAASSSLTKACPASLTIRMTKAGGHADPAPTPSNPNP